MVIMTAKVSKRKIIAIVLVAILAIVLLAVLLGRSDDPVQAVTPQEPSQTQAETPAAPQPESTGKIRTNDDRVAYLEALGWDVDDDPVQTQEVRVPTDPSEVFLRYNELQKSQGFDLLQLEGKTLHRYVYEIENYPGKDKGLYYATLLIYKDQVVGGDVSSAEKGGVMHGLAMPK